jgi:hypothetical protein
VREWREGSRKGKLLSIARKRQQAHTNRLLHMLSEPENELMMVLNKEATELELMEHMLEACLEVKPERRSSTKNKRREMEGRVRRGGRGDGRKRSRVMEAFVFEENDCLYLEDYVIPVC